MGEKEGFRAETRRKWTEIDAKQAARLAAINEKAEAKRAAVIARGDAKGRKFAGILLKDGHVTSRHGGGPVAGAHARVDTAGDLSSRITASRLILTGPLALGLRKKKDTRELYLIIEGRGWAISESVPPYQGKQAREFAAKINGQATTAAPTGDPLTQLRELGELRDAGVVTTEEFEAKKAALLERL